MPVRRRVGGVGAAAVPQAAVPDEHAALGHLGGDGVVGLAVVGRPVGQVAAGDHPGGAVGLGEVGEGPHRVAHDGRVGLGQRDQLVIGVDGLGRLTGIDGDRRQRRHQAAGVEHPLDDGEHGRVHGDRRVPRPAGQQVVDAHGVGAFEAVGRGRGAQLALEPGQVLDQRVDLVGVDGVGQDRVALLGDASDVASRVPGRLGGGHPPMVGGRRLRRPVYTDRPGPARPGTPCIGPPPRAGTET